MWKPKILSDGQVERCTTTISPNTFYMIVGDALVRRVGLSVVRMGDGERLLMNCNEPSDRFDENWQTRMGILGISGIDIKKRMFAAARNCDYFAPSVTGIVNDIFNIDSFSCRDHYVDNFFCNAWTTDMQIDLYKEAGEVLMIHGNPNTANALKSRAEKYLGVNVTYIQMTRWEEAEQVIDAASKVSAPLVIFSAGPAGKLIGPEIARQKKVVLDIGNAMDRWTLLPLYEAEKK